MKFQICHRGDFLSVQLCGVPSIRSAHLMAGVAMLIASPLSSGSRWEWLMHESG